MKAPCKFSSEIFYNVYGGNRKLITVSIEGVTW